MNETLRFLKEGEMQMCFSNNNDLLGFKPEVP